MNSGVGRFENGYSCCDSSASVSPADSPELVSSSLDDSRRKRGSGGGGGGRYSPAAFRSRSRDRTRHDSPDFGAENSDDPNDLPPGGAPRRSFDGAGNSHPLDSGAKRRGAAKYCRVCGDKALGYNFNVVTCESCKAFFRRNALKRKEFRCPYNNNCDVSPVTRRFCQKCRLKKCFEVGMKKEWIMSEEARQVKRRRIEEKRKVSGGGNNNENHLLKSVLQGNDASTSPSSSTNPDSVAPMVVEDFGEQRRSDDVQQLANQSDNISFQIHRKNGSDDKITLTRSALISLIMGSKKDAAALFRDGDDRGGEANRRSRPCVCTCTCGAKPSGARIGTAKMDRNSSTDNELYCDPGLISPIDQNRPSFGSPNLGAEVVCGEQSMLFPSTAFAGAPFSVSQRNDDGGGVFAYRETSMYNNLVNAVISSEFCGEAVSGSLIDIGFRKGVAGLYVLTDFERLKLDELISANEILKEPMEKFISDDKKDNPSLTDVLNLMDIAIRRIIKMCKRIEGFKNLCQDDQISLLKGGCMKLMLLRGVMSYDPEKDSWRGPTSHYIKVEVLKGVQGNSVYEDHKRYLQSFEAAWRTNEAIMLILGAITLFNADRPHVLRKDLVRVEQEIYYNLLKSYLDSVYAPEESRIAYHRLCKNVEHLHKLHDDATRVFLEVNLTEVEPLLVEIFDLHSQTEPLRK